MKKLMVIAMLLISSLAWAGDNAVVVGGGLAHTANSNYGDGGTLSARYERRVWGDLWAGPHYIYHGPMEHGSGNDDTPTDYGDLSGHSILADLIYRPAWARVGSLEAYVLGGAGWSWWDFNESQATRDADITVDMGDSFAYLFGVGLDYRLNANWLVGAEWSFYKTMIPKDARYSDGSYSALLGDDRASGRERLGEEESRVVVSVRYER